MYKIAVIPGDGIGVEVIREGLKILNYLNNSLHMGLLFDTKDWGAEKWLNEGVGIPANGINDLRSNYNAIYFGALGDPRIPNMEHGRDILLKLRFELDLYANIRPCNLINSKFCPLKKSDNIDFTVIRENTEDLYVGIGGRFKIGTIHEISIDESIHTKHGVERIIKYAFNFALKNNKTKVTLGDKSNAIIYSGSLWQETFWNVAKEYPSIKAEHMFVDVLAMKLVEEPSNFDIIVTSNVFGDILTDLGSAIIGGLGLACSSSIGSQSIGLFEPIHGSAPDIAGKNIANPIAAILTASEMLKFLNYHKEAQLINKSIKHICNNLKVLTHDFMFSS